jgi:hypothetical protein
MIGSKYVMAPPDYLEVVRLAGRKITHLDNDDIGLTGDFSQCGHYSKKWLTVGPLRKHEVTCKVCLKALKKMGIYPNDRR